DDWEGSKEKQYRISPRIRNILTDMKSLFESVIVNGKDPLLGLFNIGNAQEEGTGESASPGLEVGPFRAQATYGSLTLDLTLEDPAALVQPMRILNPNDKYLTTNLPGPLS